MLVPRPGHQLCQPQPVLEVAKVELGGGEGRDGRVHAVLGVQHMDRVAGRLQPLEEGDVVVEGHGAFADDRGGQLHWVPDQEHLQQRTGLVFRV